MITLLVDGYDFGDRPLRGVLFHVEVDDDNHVLSTNIAPESDNANWQGLDQAHWLEQARVHVERVIRDYGSVAQALGDEIFSTVSKEEETDG